MANKKSDIEMIKEYQKRAKQMEEKAQQIQQKINNQIANLIKKEYHIATVQELKKMMEQDPSNTITDDQIEMINYLADELDIDTLDDLKTVLEDTTETDKTLTELKSEFDAINVPNDKSGIETLIKTYKEFTKHKTTTKIDSQHPFAEN